MSWSACATTCISPRTSIVRQETGPPWRERFLSCSSARRTTKRSKILTVRCRPSIRYWRARFRANRVVNFLASRGYVVVIQDVRGRYASEGRWRMLADDGRDGFDTAQWIASQPVGSGKIGGFGQSLPGSTAHALALANAPGVSALLPLDAMSNFGLCGSAITALSSCDGSIRFSPPSRRRTFRGRARLPNGRHQSGRCWVTRQSCGQSAAVCQAIAVQGGHNSIAVCTRLRSMARRCDEPRELRCTLEEQQRQRDRAPCRIQGHSSSARHRVVRLLDRIGCQSQLRRLAEGEEESAATHDRTVDHAGQSLQFRRSGPIH